MAIELRFSKADIATSWGFRLVGGADFKEPLVVVKVDEDSLAEDVGLRVGDVIVRINNSSTAGITHADAHDLINNAGCEFVAAVRRGLFSDIPVYTKEENNNEVKNVLQESIAERLAGEQKDQVIGVAPKSLENLAGQEQIVLTTETKKVYEPNKPSKRSAFLLKPKNSKPIPKKVQEERKILGEPYRVKIIKQPKRDPKEVLNNKKTVQFDSHVTEVEISRQASLADSTDSLEISELRVEDMEVETSVKVIEETEVEIYESDEATEQDKELDTADNDSLENQIIQNEDELIIKKHKPILKLEPLDIHIDPVICESFLPLEEQLAAVQRQLLALSRLPTAIQVTLEAVTEQLNRIVLDKMKSSEVNECCSNEESQNDTENVNGSEETVEAEDPNENLSISENAEGDITENEAEDNQNFEDLEEDHGLDDKDSIEEESKVEIEDQIIEDDPDPYAGLTEEEKEEKIKEEQLLVKKQKIEEERRKMDWTQRPIVLPGGRKWTDPDDASPKAETPKMTDEKISRTIEDCSEVIVGKTKGINFLKYEPPPKNLDYLQRSEVYRLIHGMEAPERGVGARAEKIMSEKDYYGGKGAP